MLDTSFARSGWIFKRIRLKTKWAVEIARQKRFGVRQICPTKKPEPIKLNSRVVPERRAATKAKKMLKEASLKDQMKKSEIPNKNALQKQRGTGVNGNKNTGTRRGRKNSNQRKKKAKRKEIKLNRKEKALIKKFALEPCIVCVPRLEDISKAVKKATGNCDPDINTNCNGVNKRKTKKPERVVILGDSNKDPIVVSDVEDDSDVEVIESNVTFVGTANSPIVLNDDSDDEMNVVNNDYNNNFDPNDADGEDDGYDDFDNDDDSFDENSETFSDNDDEDDDMPLFSKFRNSPKTYGGIRRNFLIAPPTFQPSKFKVAPPKFMVPPSFRTGTAFNF